MQAFPSYSYDKKILQILLIDRTLNKNIVWATRDYKTNSWSFNPQDTIPLQIISQQKPVILPQAFKHQQYKTRRAQEKAEVFTPLWVCTLQNDLIDNEWFGRKDVFTTNEKITFSNKKGHRWTDYVSSKRLEITCGEAPYLVHRYNVISGEPIDLPQRMGMLDRKLRIVSENTKNVAEWLRWAKKAFQSTYGYEYQGDNLFLARRNCIDTFVDYYQARFQQTPKTKELKEIATIISWNLWQMDGLDCSVPYSHATPSQISLFSITNKQEKKQKSERIYACIRNWDTKKIIEYRQLISNNNKIVV